VTQKSILPDGSAEFSISQQSQHDCFRPTQPIHQYSQLTGRVSHALDCTKHIMMRAEAPQSDPELSEPAFHQHHSHLLVSPRYLFAWVSVLSSQCRLELCLGLSACRLLLHCCPIRIMTSQGQPCQMTWIASTLLCLMQGLSLGMDCEDACQEIICTVCSGIL
jgi:hypothetical protein